MKSELNAERKSDREIVSSRTIHASPREVFEAWRNPEIFQKWWVPKSAPITLASCQMDVRTGGTYCLVFQAGGQTAEFFGKYIEVIPNSRLVWTNDEAGTENATQTTVTFEEVNGNTLVTVHDLHASKETLDAGIADGSCGALPQQLAQLDALFVK